MSGMSEYEPGVCNIGRDERRKRRLVGSVSAVAVVALLGYLLATGRPPEAFLLSFPLFFGAAVGFVQDRMRFCVAFGALARYDLSGSSGTVGRVNDADAVRRDRLRALKLLALSTGLALAATAVVYGVVALA